MLYIKPSCNSFTGIDMADVAQTAYLHVFFEQVAQLKDKPAQTIVEVTELNNTKIIYNKKDLA